MMSTPDVSNPERPVVVLKPYGPPRGPLGRFRPFLIPALCVFCLLYGFFFALTAPYLIVPFSAPVALLGALAIWALPEMKRAPSRTMSGFLMAFVICLIAWPNYLAIVLPGLPWLTLLRLTGIPMAILLLICISVSREFRAQLGPTLRSIPFLWTFFIGFIVMQTITLPLSHNPAQSLQKLIVAQTNWTAVFVVACYVFRTPGRMERYAVLLCALAAGICLLSLVEAEQRRVLWAGHLPGFLKASEDFEYMKPIFRRYTNLYRVKATFTTPLGLAEFMALICPFMVQFIIGRYKLWARLLAAASLVLAVHTIVQTDSRLGIAGLIVSGLAYVLLWGLVRWQSYRGGLIGPAVVLAYPAFFTAMIAATFFVGRLRNMVWGGGAEQSSSDARDEQVARGIPKIFQNPIGHGAGQAADTLGFYSYGGYLTIDNYYLAIALEYGVFGFIFYYGMFLLAAGYGSLYAVVGRYAPGRDFTFLMPLAASLSSFVVIKAVFSQQDNHPLAFLMLGMVVALVYRLRVDHKIRIFGRAPASPAPEKE